MLALHTVTRLVCLVPLQNGVMNVSVHLHVYVLAALRASRSVTFVLPLTT
jgi:hypothetical protein